MQKRAIEYDDYSALASAGYVVKGFLEALGAERFHRAVTRVDLGEQHVIAETAQAGRLIEQVWVKLASWADSQGVWDYEVSERLGVVLAENAYANNTLLDPHEVTWNTWALALEGPFCCGQGTSSVGVSRNGDTYELRCHRFDSTYHVLADFDTAEEAEAVAKIACGAWGVPRHLEVDE